MLYIFWVIENGLSVDIIFIMMKLSGLHNRSISYILYKFNIGRSAARGKVCTYQAKYA